MPTAQQLQSEWTEGWNHLVFTSLLIRINFSPPLPPQEQTYHWGRHTQHTPTWFNKHNEPFEKADKISRIAVSRWTPTTFLSCTLLCLSQRGSFQDGWTEREKREVPQPGSLIRWQKGHKDTRRFRFTSLLQAFCLFITNLRHLLLVEEGPRNKPLEKHQSPWAWKSSFHFQDIYNATKSAEGNLDLLRYEEEAAWGNSVH